MSCRNGRAWSAPSFMELEKGSFGLQIGGETVDLVAARHERSRRQSSPADKVALGGEASVAGGPVGRDARAMTDAQLKAEILSCNAGAGPVRRPRSERRCDQAGP